MKQLQLEPFEAHPLIRNSHAQTLFAEVFDAKTAIGPFRTIEVRLPDHDTLVCEYLVGTSDLVCLMGHGLTGDSQSAYLIRTAQHLNRLGHHIVLLNHRNCGVGYGKASRPYNSGKGDDIGAVIQNLREKFKEHKIFFYGYSMSGNAGLRLIAEPQVFFKENISDYLPDAAFVANPPINLHRSSFLLSQGFNRVYEKYFIWGLKKLVQKQIKDHLLDPEKINPKKINLKMKIKDFDHLFTSVYSGYKDADDYYTKSSTYSKLNQISIPTLIISSRDDSFVDSQDFPVNLNNPSLQIHLTSGGGHLGYICKRKTPLGNHRWLDYAAVEFTNHLLAERQ